MLGIRTVKQKYKQTFEILFLSISRNEHFLFFRGITKTVPSLFRGIFGNKIPVPTLIAQQYTDNLFLMPTQGKA
jgi:hypothetical protein